MAQLKKIKIFLMFPYDLGCNLFNKTKLIIINENLFTWKIYCFVYLAFNYFNNFISQL